MQKVNGFQVHRHNETRIQQTLKTIIDKGRFSVLIEQHKTERGVMVSTAITPAGHSEIAAVERSVHLDDASVAMPVIEAPNGADGATLLVRLKSAGIVLRLDRATMVVEVRDLDQRLLESISASPNDLSDEDGGAAFIKRQRRYEYDE